MSDDRALRSVDVIGLVARREIAVRLRATSFRVGTALLVLVLIAIGGISRFARDDGPGAVEVGVVSAAADLAPIEQAFEDATAVWDREISIVRFDDVEAARAAVRAGDVDVAVDPVASQAVFREEIDDETSVLVQQTWARLTVEARLADAGLGALEIEEALAVAPLTAVSLEEDDRPSDLGMLTGSITAILLLLSLQTFGTYVLTGVVEEKSSAVVEILLVRARADQLLAGKIIGIGVAALTQFVAAVAAGLISLVVSGTDVPGEIWSAVPMTVVWFLGGFTVYSTLFALAGSLVSRQEDAQSAAAPISYCLVAAYLVVFLFGIVPDSTASTVLSMLPPTAPFLMPLRMAAGAASPVEVAIALAGLLLSTIGAWKLSGRIYEQVLLRRGTRIGWREALSLLRRP